MRESLGRGVVDVAAVDATATPAPADARMRLWRGDVRRLAVDAVVNAANSALLGCFAPAHRCLDNQLHAAAGPWLRDECARRREHDDDEPVGGAFVTRAYALPATAIVHTVGPAPRHDSADGVVTDVHRAGLRRCYESILAAAEEHKWSSIALTSVSTGLFGFPREEAADIAVDVVRRHLESKAAASSLRRVIFVAYAAADEIALGAALGVSVSPQRAADNGVDAAIARAAAAIRDADVVIVTVRSR